MKKHFFSVAFIFLFSFSTVGAQSPQLKQADSKPKIINGGVINGKARELPKPVYPPAAQAVKASGTVNVQVVIDEAGNVSSASAVSGHPLLRAAAESAARQARFSPTTLSGQPVKVSGIIVYNFILPEAEPTLEKQLLVMGLSSFLAVSEIMPNDEWESLDKKDLREVPQIAAELEPLTTITKATTKKERLEIIKKVSAALESKFTGADAWQFKFGKEFGGLMIDLKQDSERTDVLLDEMAVKTRLIKLRDLLITVPEGFPPDVLSNFKEMVKFADVPNLNADENKNTFVQLIMKTLNTISPDAPK